ncbi:MAG TPA: hypothetical protein VF710_05245 [Longimicrobium sp.]
MPLLPFSSFIIDSPLPPARAAAELANNVEPRRLLRFRRGAAAFEGEVTESGVDIRRLPGYQNSFLPEIRGSFERTPHGSRLRGTMRMHPLVIAFMCAWMAFTLIAGLAMAAASLGAGKADPAALIPLAMLFFGWAFPTAAFTIEAGMARRALTEILAREIPSRAGTAAGPRP